MSGRPIPDPGFPGDDGTADPALSAALQAWVEDEDLEAPVYAGLARARVLVPVVAVLAEEAPVGPGALRREKSTDMALVTLVGTDGRRALPVFTSVSSLAAWRRDARPVPVEAARAALSAAGEGAELLVLDVAGPVTFLVEGPVVAALARGRQLRPLYADADVLTAVADALHPEPTVRSAWLEPVAGADARLVLVLDAGPDRPAVASRVAGAVAAAPAVRGAVVLGLQVAVVPPGGNARPDAVELVRSSPPRPQQ